MLPELPFFFSLAVFEESRRCMASQRRPSSLMEVLGDTWVMMRGEYSPSSAAAVSSAASDRTTTRDVQSTRFFVSAATGSSSRVC
ncbi:hypothetical protein PI125_g23544 [Phytophthora idaei]|nr:hypothetical protein PI125_g23544 [Phytophthora idaei]